MKGDEVGNGASKDVEALAGKWLLSGEAWGDFLSRLDRAGRNFLEKEFPGNAQMRALAHRHLMRRLGQ